MQTFRRGWGHVANRRVWTACLGLGAMVLVSGAAWAQYDDGTYASEEKRYGADAYGPHAGEWEFTLSGSATNDEEFDAGAFSLAGSLGYFLSDGFEAGVRHNMAFFDSDQTKSSFAATTRLFADYHIDFGRIQPFLGANVGLRYGDSGINETGTFAPEWGLKLFALENTFLLGMMEYQIFFEDENNARDNAENGQFVYTVGIGFLF